MSEDENKDIENTSMFNGITSADEHAAEETPFVQSEIKEPLETTEITGEALPESEPEPQVKIIYKEPEKPSKTPLVVLTVLLICATIYICFQSAYVFMLTSGKLERANKGATKPTEADTEPVNTEISNEEAIDPHFSIEDAAAVHIDGKKTLSTVEICEVVSPATVTIYIYEENATSYDSAVSAGSGFIISKDGYIVTNEHVVADLKNEDFKGSIKVYVQDYEEPFEATVVGSDIQTDIAVIKIEPDKELKTVTLGDSDILRNGELAVAIGNPLGTFEGTITVGVVSGKERPMNNNGYTMNLIQTDASVNNGNSGGPLLNSFGEVVGVVNAKISTAEGLGFAIPINSVKGIIESLIQHGYVADRPYLGITVGMIMEESYFGAVEGVYVQDLFPDGPGARAGFKIDDKIVKMDGIEIKTTSDIIEIRDSHKVGDVIECVVERDGKEVTLNLTIGDSHDYNG